MGTLTLSEVEIEGTRSFVERVLIKLPKSGMVLINGIALDTGISSGCGKSTIPIAVAQSLDCCDIPATVLKSRYGGKQYVRSRLTDDSTGDVYDVIRSPKLSLKVNGEDKGSGKAAEDKFREIIRASSDLIKSLTYRQQREKGQFLTRTDSQNKEFLSALLGLSALEEASDSLASEAFRFSTEVGNLRSQIASSETTIATLASAKAQIPDAETRYSAAQQRYSLLSGATSQGDIQQKIASLQSEINRINGVSQQAHLAQSENKRIRDQVMSIQTEIEQVSAQICPTCRREWDNGQNYLDSLRERSKTLLKQMEGNMVVINSAAPMQETLPTLQADLAAQNQKLGEAQAPLADAYSAMNSAKSLLEQLNSQARHHDSMVNDVASKQRRIAEVEAEASTATLAADLVSRGGFLSVIFDGVLKEIETRANAMIGQVPNVSTFSIQILSSHETQKGTIKKTIAVKIFKDGDEVPYKSLSGGQQCALELFTDLAVRETVRMRSGSPVGWTFLDEAMDGLDVETKKAALAVIRKSISGTIIIIDHSTEIKEMFDQVVQVEFDGRTSRVKS